MSDFTSDLEKQDNTPAIHTGTIVQWTCLACGNQWGVRTFSWETPNFTNPDICWRCKGKGKGLAAKDTANGGD